MLHYIADNILENNQVDTQAALAVHSAFHVILHFVILVMETLVLKTSSAEECSIVAHRPVDRMMTVATVVGRRMVERKRVG